MKRYRLTKGALSRVRFTREHCEELVKEGYTFDGEVDEKNRLIDDRVRLADLGEETQEDGEKSNLVEQARKLGLGAPSALKRLSVETLRQRIEEAGEED